MNRQDAIQYLSPEGLDNAMALRRVEERPENARFIGWQCGAEPMFVAVWSYLPGNPRLDDDEAIDLVVDRLCEKKWFADGPTQPDYVL
jgi:hypothetical protein